MELKTLGAAFALAAQLRKAVSDIAKPPSSIVASRAEPTICMSMVGGTCGYLENVAHQVNGAYANGWYDASAVMIRRFLETLIIECFETYEIEHKIRDRNGDYPFLRDPIDRMSFETAWTLGRNVRRSLPRLKDVRHKSAHSRRFNAHREERKEVQFPNRMRHSPPGCRCGP